MNRYNYAELTARLPGSGTVPAPNVVQFPLQGGPPPTLAAIFGARPRPSMNAAAMAGMPGGFDALVPAAKDTLLAAILSFPPIARMTDAPRAEWLSLLFALADAERLGAADARRLALDWSKPGQTFDRADFDRDWRSFQPGRTGVGTLLDAARKVGFDLDPWLHPAPASPALPLPPGGFMQPLPVAARTHPRLGATLSA